MWTKLVSQTTSTIQIVMQKKMVRLTFLEKKVVFQSEISTYSLILFSKNIEILSVKELFKVNQIDIPDYQYY